MWWFARSMTCVAIYHAPGYFPVPVFPALVEQADFSCVSGQRPRGMALAPAHPGSHPAPALRTRIAATFDPRLTNRHEHTLSSSAQAFRKQHHSDSAGRLLLLGRPGPIEFIQHTDRRSNGAGVVLC